MWRGQIFFFEVKTPDKHEYILKHWDRLKQLPKLNREQERFLNQIRFCEKAREEGFVCEFVSSLKQVIEVLESKS